MRWQVLPNGQQLFRVDAPLLIKDRIPGSPAETTRWIKQAGREPLLIAGVITQEDHCQFCLAMVGLAGTVAEKVESFGSNTPLGRAGQPAELAPAHVMLASPESSYITGAVIPEPSDA